MYIGILNFTTINITPDSGALFVGWGMIGILVLSPIVIYVKDCDLYTLIGYL